MANKHRNGTPAPTAKAYFTKAEFVKVIKVAGLENGNLHLLENLLNRYLRTYKKVRAEVMWPTSIETAKLLKSASKDAANLLKKLTTPAARYAYAPRFTGDVYTAQETRLHKLENNKRQTAFDNEVALLRAMQFRLKQASLEQKSDRSKFTLARRRGLIVKGIAIYGLLLDLRFAWTHYFHREVSITQSSLYVAFVLLVAKIAGVKFQAYDAIRDRLRRLEKDLSSDE